MLLTEPERGGTPKSLFSGVSVHGDLPDRGPLRAPQPHSLRSLGLRDGLNQPPGSRWTTTATNRRRDVQSAGPGGRGCQWGGPLPARAHPASPQQLRMEVTVSRGPRRTGRGVTSEQRRVGAQWAKETCPGSGPQRADSGAATTPPPTASSLRLHLDPSDPGPTEKGVRLFVNRGVDASQQEANSDKLVLSEEYAE